MKEIEEVIGLYVPLAQACSKIFFAVQSMSQIHYLYEFSLTFFMEIFINLLTQDAKIREVPKANLVLRRQLIIDLIFRRIYERIQNSLLSRDKLIFMLRLVQIRLPHDS